MLDHPPNRIVVRNPEADESLRDRLLATRRRSLAIAEPLTPEDMTIQVMDDASPTKWHLAHVTWFFETFLLSPSLPGYRVFDDTFRYCFNSYYESLGNRQPRPMRGLLSRPSAERVFAYRAHVDEALDRLLDTSGSDHRIASFVELGIQHEQQHQELMLTDILALFAANPLRPVYRPFSPVDWRKPLPRPGWIDHPGGICEIGHGGTGFSWDNERPRHTVLVHPFRIADRLVTNGEWLEFIGAGAYRNPLLWLADGWAQVQRGDWQAPGYWERHDGGWRQMTLHGLLPPNPAAPVTHVSYYEADAFARWTGKRLPREQEWEVAAADASLPTGESADSPLFPQPLESNGVALQQAFAAAWQWTASAYLPYPGYVPPAGAIGEYNGKFMVSQHVLRGSSCVTPPGHARSTYRNFFYPHQRWQFTGVRLAEDGG